MVLCLLPKHNHIKVKYVFTAMFYVSLYAVITEDWHCKFSLMIKKGKLFSPLVFVLRDVGGCRLTVHLPSQLLHAIDVVYSEIDVGFCIQNLHYKEETISC